MASTCISVGHTIYGELEDPVESDDISGLRSWQVRQAVRPSSCLWRNEVLTRARTVHYSPSKSRKTLDNDLIWNFRQMVERIQASPHALSSLRTHEYDELNALVQAVQDLMADLLRDPADERDQPNEPDEHSLIDWRAINRRQWETGMRATLGEDGEPLVALGRRLRVQHTLEDDYEESLPE